MLTDTAIPSPARDLVRIHRVITRGLATGIEKGNYFKQAGFEDSVLKQGFCDYCRSLAVVLGGHHQGEDAVVFPVFKEKITQAPYDLLAEQHRQIEACLVSIHKAVDEMTGAPGDGLDWLVDALNEISEVWAPHIRMEESIFSHEAVCAVMSPAEQGQLAARIGKFSQEHSIPPYLIVPFVLFNLDIEDRRAMLANLPGNILNDLVLKAWKDQWATMKPFLLE
jgi:hypothetical protein